MPNHSPTWNFALLAMLFALLTACGETETKNSADQTHRSELPDTIFLETAPQDISSIASLKSTAKEGDEVAVRVVVGGSIDPVVPGRASATIIDASLTNPCLSDDDHCETPWDYCCTAVEDKTKNMATLQITDDDGNVLKADLAPRIKPLTTLVIVGIVGPRPDEQVLTIDARKIYIENEAQ